MRPEGECGVSVVDVVVVDTSRWAGGQGQYAKWRCSRGDFMAIQTQFPASLPSMHPLKQLQQKQKGLQPRLTTRGANGNPLSHLHDTAKLLLCLHQASKMREKEKKQPVGGSP